jgi:hypothetical protein
LFCADADCARAAVGGGGGGGGGGVAFFQKLTKVKKPTHGAKLKYHNRTSVQ